MFIGVEKFNELIKNLYSKPKIAQYNELEKNQSELNNL